MSLIFKQIDLSTGETLKRAPVEIKSGCHYVHIPNGGYFQIGKYEFSSRDVGEMFKYWLTNTPITGDSDPRFSLIDFVTKLEVKMVVYDRDNVTHEITRYDNFFHIPESEHLHPNTTDTKSSDIGLG